MMVTLSCATSARCRRIIPLPITMATSAIYLHGGPGMHPESERHLLYEPLRRNDIDTAFWTEPSLLRPESGAFDPDAAWQNSLASAERMLLDDGRRDATTIIAHSFGAHIA